MEAVGMGKRSLC